MVSRKHCYECANYLTEFSKKFWWITVSKTARAASVLFWWLLAVGRTVNLLYFSSLRSTQQWSLTSSVIGQQFLETLIRSGGQGYFGILFIQHEYRIHMYFNWHWNRLAGITCRRAAIWEHSPCTVSTFLTNVSCYCRLDECTLACAHIATRCSVSSLLFASVLQLSAYIRNNSSSDYSRIRCNYHLVPQIPYPIFFFFCR